MVSGGQMEVVKVNGWYAVAYPVEDLQIRGCSLNDAPVSDQAA
jgi:hypothetical protein